MTRFKLVLCSMTIWTWAATLSLAFGTDLPRNSVYQLEVMLTDQDGHSAMWSQAAHQPAGPRIVSMFYSHCDYVCPMLFEAIKNIETQLPAAQRQRLRVGLITLDPARDDVASLKKTADLRAGDPARWRLYRTQSADVRKLAGVLGVQYRQLSNGEFNHSTVMILLDARGVELARTNQIAKPDPGFLQALLKATALPSAQIH
jgi:protein SCO1